MFEKKSLYVFRGYGIEGTGAQRGQRQNNKDKINLREQRNVLIAKTSKSSNKVGINSTMEQQFKDIDVKTATSVLMKEQEQQCRDSVQTAQQ